MVNIGFAALEKQSVGNSTNKDWEDGFSLGATFTHAFVNNPDIFGYDMRIDYGFSNISKIREEHNFLISSYSWVDNYQFFKPFVHADIGYETHHNKDTNGGNSENSLILQIGLGIENVWTDGFSTRMYLDKKIAGLDTPAKVGFGTTIWVADTVGFGIDAVFGFSSDVDSSQTEESSMDLTTTFGFSF